MLPSVTSAWEGASLMPVEVSVRKSGSPGGEAILVVEDEDDVRALVVEALTGYGYVVFDAPDGPHALDVWKAHGDDIDLLLTDMVMPGGMTGLDLARRLRAERPALKVVYTSGYLPNLTNGGVLEEGKNFLPKPFPLPELARVIRQRLDSDL